MVSQAELILTVITLWFLILSHFLEMGPFKKTINVIFSLDFQSN